jgi:hypothetical protein
MCEGVRLGAAGIACTLVACAASRHPADGAASADAQPEDDAVAAEDAPAVDAAADAGAPAIDAGVTDAGPVVAERHDAASIDAGSADAPDDVGIDSGPPDSGQPDAGPRDAWRDLCAGVACPGTACRAAVCDPRTGECAPAAPRADGTACDDLDACTRTDACAAGACVGGDRVTCPPADACHAAGVCDGATGACSSATMPCTTDVLVRVRDARGGTLPAPVIVRAFSGDVAKPQGGITDPAGEIHLVLPGGSYRFRAQRDGIPFWSGTTDHCAMPSCTFVEMRLPDATPDRVVSWDPLFEPVPDGRGEVGPADPHVARGGTYLENWAIERYGLPDAFVSTGHTHLYPQPWDAPDAWGNPTVYENQHALGTTLQGIYVRTDDGRRFDLVSIDYRIRADSDPTHVSAIAGADPGDVAIWIADALATPRTSWRAYATGRPANVAMTFWSSIFPAHFTNVTGVFITTTANVSLDDVVIRPR